jgi:hypothetical protein
VSAVSLPRPARPGRVRPTRRGRFVLGVVLLSVVAVGILAMRLSNRPAASTAVQPATTHSLTPVPHSAAIEQAWGVRFSALILGGDRGMLDVRYVVVNPAKSARLHGGSVTNPDPNAAVKNLPTFIKEGGGGAIVPTSAMMHFEHFHFQTETLGSGFSILYGNAGGLLHIGDKVTIRMVDGLELKHVVVTS